MTSKFPNGLFVKAIMLLLFLSVSLHGFSEPKKNLILAIDAGFGVKASTSAKAIELGARIAANEINAAGGLLGGRQLEVITRNNNSIPARSEVNLKELAANPDVVAVMTDKWSPIIIELLPMIHELKIPVLNPWAAADSITDHEYRPNYVFRLSLTDTWAMKTMVSSVKKRGFKRIGLLLPYSGWGRSSHKALKNEADLNPEIKLVADEWYNYGDKDLSAQYDQILKANADVIILVANELEGAVAVELIANVNPEQRIPVLSHWGITGGTFFELSEESLEHVDFSVIQTYSFIDATDPIAQYVKAQAINLSSANSERTIQSPVGVAHAYDLTHLLAQAIMQAGSINREQIRDALEKLPPYKGLVKNYLIPFAEDRHDALDEAIPFMASYATDGAIVRKD